MRRDRETPTLVCPRCRGPQRRAAPLVRASDDLRCRRCRARYPLVDGVPIILNDPTGWDAQTPRDAVMTRALGSPSRSPLAGLVRAQVADLRGPVLDMGCGGGALYDRTAVVGLDLNLAMARLFGPGAVVADAADPPFEPAAFGSVLLLNLLDSCVHPRLVLAQADALLRPAGTLVISCAYSWTPAVAVDRRFEPDELLACLEGDPARAWIRGRYRLLNVRNRVPWRLRVTSRLVHEYSCQLVVARKRASG